MGGINTFAYVLANPLAKSDASGLCSDDDPPMGPCEKGFFRDVARQCVGGVLGCVAFCAAGCRVFGPYTRHCLLACMGAACGSVATNCIRGSVIDYALCKLKLWPPS